MTRRHDSTPRSRLQQPRFGHRLQTTMDLASSLVIHGVLPNEILGAIFEEHARLESRAPAIDGRVCRVWRQIVLDTPRAWAYLDICSEKKPRMEDLRPWLGRSGAALLHISVEGDPRLDGHIDKWTLCDLLRECHTRIISLRMVSGALSFFDGLEFPCMRLLEVKEWDHYPLAAPWGPMPALRSLCLASTDFSVIPLDNFVSLEVLTLSNFSCTSLPRHSQSLTTLMLDAVSFADEISGPLTFSSLTYLSLYNVRGFKPYIIAPCLVTYHEGEGMGGESFLGPIPSLVEYGIHGLRIDDSDPREWDLLFPNIVRISIRADPSVLISFFASLSGHPHSLPALKMISAGSIRRKHVKIPEGDQEIMESLVRVRSEVCNRDVALCIETGPPFKIPLIFGVSYCPSDDLWFPNIHTSSPNFVCEGRRVCACSTEYNPPRTFRVSHNGCCDPLFICPLIPR
jgi:F-box-like